ncbi:21874_t:CDS:2 [Dentiscutata erythropus]|uniref:21874_t:CDS:1 n=1 Tax=Dentiscutata erythropus TaxID=1348616 RepID=A0A9N9DB50_9GLOM|nr:21874_t:CDS:2 [Dentiscutata erythropus]
MSTPNYSEQLDAYLKNKNVKIFDYSQFKDLVRIGSGSFGTVYSATFQGVVYALKSMKNNLKLEEKEFKNFKHELKTFYRANNHPNVIKFYGIAKEVDNFMLILQLADGGNLQDYLFKKQIDNTYKISWSELIQFAIDITKGLREMPISNTPSDYSNIYQRCWSSEPSQRPSTDEILDVLKTSKKIDDFYLENKVDNSLEEILNIFVTLTNNGSDFLQISKSIKETINEQQESLIIEETISKQLNSLYDNSNDSSEFLCLLGYFYLEGIGTKKDQKVAFSTFQQAANENVTAKFYLGECFRRGYGTTKNLKNSILWYKKAAEDKHARSANALGLCYMKRNCFEFGRGTKTDKEMAFRYYHEAADHSIPFGQYNIAECYRKGTGVVKNLQSANDWYKKAADNGYEDATSMLSKLG